MVRVIPRSNVMTVFAELVAQDVGQHVKAIQGAKYLPWALSLGMAGLPAQKILTFTGANGSDTIVRPLFGGGVVAVSQKVGERDQITYLPITDLKNVPIDLRLITAREASDTMNRCRARSVALVQGYGLSLYSSYQENGSAYSKALGITADTNLTRMAAVHDVKEFRDKVTKKLLRTQNYLGWHAALAAARITDPAFHWEIVETSVQNEVGQIESIPAMRLDGVGWMVGVAVTWKGTSHTEWLPIMGIRKVMTNSGEKPLEHQALDTPNVFQWHSAVMRCLAKAIALRTGYGLSLYGGDHAVGDHVDVPADEPMEVQGGSPEENVSSTASAPEGGDVEQSLERAGNLAELRKILAEISTPEAAVCRWLIVDRLEDASDSKLATALTNARNKLRESKVATGKSESPLANAA